MRSGLLRFRRIPHQKNWLRAAGPAGATKGGSGGTGFRRRAGGLMALAAVLVTLPSTTVAARFPVPSERAATLQAALDQAAPGDIIQLAPGRYLGPVQVRKPLTLTGAKPAGVHPAAVVLDGAGLGRTLEIFAPGVMVRGLTIQHSGDEVGNSDACVYVHETAAGAHIADSVLRDCAFGIWVNGAPDVLIKRNTISGRNKRIFSDRGNGINLWQSHRAVVLDNTIEQVRDGILLSVSTGTSIRANRLRNLRFGLHYMYNDQNHLSGNLACRSQVGLALMFSKRLEVFGNIALDNQEHGILFRSVYDSRITDNHAQGNGKGFFLNETGANQITGNRVSGNRIGVHITGGSENNQVSGNDFMANGVQVRYSINHSIQWQGKNSGNYWSDYLGWDLNGDGWGDRTYYSAHRMDSLLASTPQIKLLAYSPLVQLMQSLEARFPVLRPPGVIDARPLMGSIVENPLGPPQAAPPSAPALQTLAMARHGQSGIGQEISSFCGER